MKGIAEIPIVGLIGTITIIAGILIPPAIVKTTIDKELAQTVKWEDAQHLLITLFSLNKDGSVYQILGEKIVYESYSCITSSDCPIGYSCENKLCHLSTENLNNILSKSTDSAFCINPADTVNSVDVKTKSTQEIPAGDVLKAKCGEYNTNFATIMVLPYNKNSLFKYITIGVQ